MVLMTPEAEYDPGLGFSILKQFPAQASTLGMERLRRNNVLVNPKKGGGDRIIPGVRMALSEKFV